MTHQVRTNVNNELFILSCTVSHMWMCFMPYTNVHVLFFRGGIQEARSLSLFFFRMKFLLTYLLSPFW